MGSMGPLARLILEMTGVDGIFIAGTAHPDLLRHIWLPERESISRQALSKSLKRLIKIGLMRYTPAKGGWRLVLTKRGEARFYEYELGFKKITQPDKWDGKWRILAFDIAEKRRHLRDRVRCMLKAFGFYQLQRSMWVYPYDCEEALDLLRSAHGVHRDALLIVAERIDGDRWLREYFGLEKLTV